ncbi:helix-turn-helix domain-containing protein [Kordiimonas sp.]|uniref:helix-turn-helix domain-containing protein n=1 Tax=Kordiimonas sp. TaxID=1970157 RepID=UPI003A91118A
MIRGEQIRAARAILGWSQSMLSESSGVSLTAIRRIEPQDGTPGATARTLERIEKAFNSAGVFFECSESDSVVRRTYV